MRVNNPGVHPSYAHAPPTRPREGASERGRLAGYERRACLPGAPPFLSCGRQEKLKCNILVRPNREGFQPPGFKICVSYAPEL
jgi:hypothetical protein